jgi:hypothetical protein
MARVTQRCTMLTGTLSLSLSQPLGASGDTPGEKQQHIILEYNICLLYMVGAVLS